ncbi:hypothetical protein AMAG_01720 [Allomyces macrogynus ATCC 38327]|uniref:SH3 domain-containing protein n=1 Tax=Allomyces macrogynus (strain ATCC 38327) TaxID=578462 RepID=A0A0L0S0C0_ALLM3|nr:hypothetical protein AMAG_01720 [Allomyces macrogynus ATCC 38327]|eukprot:KNE55850.1 hypothetical protein AMAG_01720 [Allomyces macrogynus ATCC 38327]
MPAVAHAPDLTVRRAAHASSSSLSPDHHALTATELASLALVNQLNLARLRPRTVPPGPEPAPFPVLPVALGITAAVLILASAVAWWLARRRRRDKQQRRRSESASLKAPSVRASSHPRTVSMSSTSPPHAPIPHVLPAPATPRASLHSTSSGSRVSVDVVVPLTAPAVPPLVGSPDTQQTRQVPKRKASLKRHASLTAGGGGAASAPTAADPQPPLTSTTPNSSCSSTVLTRSARSDLSSLLDDPIPMVALARFMVSNSDELAIAPGDKLLVYKICSDGWVLAVDEMGNEGFVPATCLVATAVLKRLAQSDAGRSGSPAALLEMARRMGIDAASAGMAPAAEPRSTVPPPVKSASAPGPAPTHLAASFTQFSEPTRPATSLPAAPASPILPTITPRPLVSPVATRRPTEPRARAGSTPTVPRAASISRSPSASRVSRSASMRSSTGGRRSMAAAELPGGSLRAVVPQYRPSLHISEDDVLFEALHAIAHLERPLAPQNAGKVG